MGYKSGFIALIGAPNVGKSTLMNALLGQKLSIVSPRPQTTRNRILGVKHVPGGQCVFLDTPGILEPRGLLNQALVQAALKTIADANLVLLLIEPFMGTPPMSVELAKKLVEVKPPVFLVINKIDRVDKGDLLPLMEQMAQVELFKEIIPISGLKRQGLDILEERIFKALPEGPPYFPEDMVTDLSERFLAGEIIREKVFRLTSREVPYAAAVTVESFKERPDKPMLHIQATIHVERDSQKAILIGKGGAKLKAIAQQAREGIEKLLGSKVFLEVWVRVEKNWSRDPRQIRRFGYEEA
jgi:GTP-binding protein Era